MPEIGTEQKEPVWSWRIGLSGGKVINLWLLMLGVAAVLFGIVWWADWMVAGNVAEQEEFCQHLNAVRIETPSGYRWACEKDGVVVYNPNGGLR